MSTKKLMTIGFTESSAETFFTKLRESGVKRVVDVRLRNTSQLAGFAKSDDLKYFLKAICGIDYVHRPDLAPTPELLNGYKKKEISWDTYEDRYLKLAAERGMDEAMRGELRDGDCLLCSERMPSCCHRRLLAEFLENRIGGMEVCHL